MAKQRDKGLEGLIAKGENPNGFTAQTPTGTAHWHGTGWNQEDYVFERQQGAPTPVSRGPRTNRTGE